MNEFRCPSCGKKLFDYYPRVRKYGKIIRTCKKCRADFLDPRYHEMAIDGILEEEFAMGPYIFMIILGALIAWRGYYLFGVHQLGTPDEVQWLMPTLFMVLGIGFILGAIISIILIKTGVKSKKFDRLYAESKERLRDVNYLKALKNLGYELPTDLYILTEE